MSSIDRPPAKAVRRLRRSVGPEGTLLATGGVGAAVFALLITASADVYEGVTNTSGVSGLDRPVLDLAVSLRSPQLNSVITAFTNVGSTIPMIFITLTLTAVMYVHWRRRSILILMLIASAGSLIFTAVGKSVVGRARPPFSLAVPPYEYAPSFPSGHTLNATVITLMLAYLAWWLSEKRWVRVLCLAFAAAWSVAMGLSRVYLGHHWMTDVMFGWLFGLAWLALLVTVHRIVLRLDRRDRQIAERGGVPDQPPERAIEPSGDPHAPDPPDPRS